MHLFSSCQMGITEVLNSPKLKSLPLWQKSSQCLGNSIVYSGQHLRAVSFTVSRPQSSWEITTETQSLSMGSQRREQESVWYACGCFELLRTYTAVFCSSRVSWGLVASRQVDSTPADLRAGYVSECFPPPPDLFSSQNGKRVSPGIFPEASEQMHSCSKTQLVHSCPLHLGICSA